MSELVSSTEEEKQMSLQIRWHDIRKGLTWKDSVANVLVLSPEFVCNFLACQERRDPEARHLRLQKLLQKLVARCHVRKITWLSASRARRSCEAPCTARAPSACVLLRQQKRSPPQLASSSLPRPSMNLTKSAKLSDVCHSDAVYGSCVLSSLTPSARSGNDRSVVPSCTSDVSSSSS